MCELIEPPLTAESLDYNIQDYGMDIFGCGEFIGGVTW